MCALTSSRLDDFFRYNYVYTVMITIIFLVGGGGGGKLGILGRESLCPSNTIDRTLPT